MRQMLFKVVPATVVLMAAVGIGVRSIRSASDQPAVRSFEMGLSYWPQDGRETSDELIGKSIGQTISLSDHILVQLPWSPMHPDVAAGAAWMSGIARQHARGLTIAMDWMEPSRDRLRDSGQKAWNFNSEETRDAFVRSAVDCARMYHPEYLVLGVEVNYFSYSDPAGFRDFVTAYERAYREVKQASPTTKVLVTFQYEVLMGLDREWTATAGMEPVHAFGPLLDVTGLSTYPFLAGHENERTVSAGYFAPVKTMARPWGIFETSHPTIAPSKSDWEDQAAFAKALLAACTEQGASIVIWCGTTDTHSAPHAVLKATSGQDGRWMANLGLCDIDANPKTVVAAWRSTFSLMRRPSLAFGAPSGSGPGATKAGGQ